MRLVYLVLGWVAGIIVADRVLSLTSTTWLVLAVGLILIISINRREYRFNLMILLLFALGGLRISLYPDTSSVAAFNNTDGLTIQGIVNSAPDVRDNRVLLRVDVQTVNTGGTIVSTSGTVLVQTSSTIQVRYGDVISATGRLITPAEYDTFSYADYLARTGIFSMMRNAIVEVDTVGSVNLLYDLRANAADLIAAHLPEPQAGLLTGILLGNERGISSELQTAFSITGAAHVIAISGFNMAIIAGLVTRLFRRLFSRRWLVGTAAITTIAIYTLFVGANPAVVRAAVMSSLVVIAELSRRKVYLPASLAFVALLMSVQNPSILWDLSFQLSFFATLGLALFVDPLETYFNRFLTRLFSESVAVRLHAYLTEPLIVTLAVLVFTLPLSVMYFNQISLVLLPVNLLIVPVQAAILLIGGAATLLAFFVPAIAQILFWGCMILLSWTISIVRGFAQLPFAQVSYTLDPRVVFVFFVVVIGWAMMQATQPAWWIAITRFVRCQTVVTTTALCGLGVVILTFGIYTARPDGQFHVYLLDVGHTNAVFMQTPGGAQLLIDGGQYPSRLLTAIGDRMPFNDREIEVVFITQPDEYQFSALPAVFARYDTGVIITNGQPNLSPAYTVLQAAMADRRVLNVTADYTLEIDDGTRVEVLYPQTTPGLTDAIADQALTLRVSYGEVSFLFTSGLNPDGQFALLKSGQSPLATVLQLPRHGGIRSLADDFLVAVQPSLVLLQSDRANTFGDPHIDTLAMVGDIPLYRTDQHGTIHVWTNGHDLWVQPEQIRE